MTKKEVVEMYEVLSVQEYTGVKFNYFVARNMNSFGKEVDALAKSLEQTDDFKKYEKERTALAEKYSQKTDDGTPMVKDNQYVIEDQKSFDKEMKKLQSSNKTTLEARQKQFNDYNKFLEEESDAVPYMINQRDLPSDIKTKDMIAIFNLIEE